MKFDMCWLQRGISLLIASNSSIGCYFKNKRNCYLGRLGVIQKIFMGSIPSVIWVQLHNMMLACGFDDLLQLRRNRAWLFLKKAIFKAVLFLFKYGLGHTVTSFGCLNGWWSWILSCKSDYYYTLLLFCLVKIGKVVIYTWKYNRHTPPTPFSHKTVGARK